MRLFSTKVRNCTFITVFTFSRRTHSTNLLNILFAVYLTKPPKYFSPSPSHSSCQFFPLFDNITNLQMLLNHFRYTLQRRFGRFTVEHEHSQFTMHNVQCTIQPLSFTFTHFPITSIFHYDCAVNTPFPTTESIKNTSFSIKVSNLIECV